MTEPHHFAFDKQTAAGERRGRGADRFFAEGIKLENEVGDDPYRNLARITMTAGPAVESKAVDTETRLF